MPFTLKNPPTFSKNMPKAAQKIAVDTFNAVFDETEDETKARMAAISNIKREFKKVGNKWVPKGALVEVLMTITKATIQPDGSMRWQCVASETTQDNVGEFTSIPLFQDWIYRAKNQIEIPFLSPPKEHPFLGLSHYPDLDGLADAGPSENMYIDGNRFKASGFFYGDSNHPLGKALFSAVRQESELIQKGEVIEKPIRISAAWWDIAHQHGNFVFERKSINDVCPMCTKGQKEDKKYLKGQLDHFAATRVPIHPATSLGLEEKAMTTRKEDANSIIDNPELVDEIDKKAKLLGKSETEDEGLVVKAKTKTIDGKSRPAGDFLVVSDPDKSSTWSLPVKVNGKLDRRLMGAAWAALHKGFRGQKFEGPNKQEAIDKLKKFYDQEGADPPPVTKSDLEIYEDIFSEPDIQQMHLGQQRDFGNQYGSKYDRDKYEKMRDEYETDKLTHRQVMLDRYGVDFIKQHGDLALQSSVDTEKSDVDTEKFGNQAVAIANNEGEPNPGILPFGGAVTIKEATNFIKANDMLAQSIDRMDIFNTVINNIFQFVSDKSEQVKLVKQATKDLSKAVAQIKNAVTDAILIQPLEQEKGEIMTEDLTPIVEQAERLDPERVPFDNAFDAIKRAMKEEDQEKRKVLFTKAMSKLGRKVEQMFKGDVIDDMEGYIDLAVQRAMSPIAEQLGLISAKLGQQQTQVPVAQDQPQQVPQQKSFQPALVDPAGQQANQLPVSPVTGQPSQLRKIAMQKAGLL